MMDPRLPPVVLTRGELEALERLSWKRAWYAAIAGFVAGVAVVPAAAWIRELLERVL